MAYGVTIESVGSDGTMRVRTITIGADEETGNALGVRRSVREMYSWESERLGQAAIGAARRIGKKTTRKRNKGVGRRPMTLKTRYP